MNERASLSPLERSPVVLHRTPTSCLTASLTVFCRSESTTFRQGTAASNFRSLGDLYCPNGQADIGYLTRLYN